MFLPNKKQRRLLSVIMLVLYFLALGGAFVTPALSVPKSVPSWKWNQIQSRWMRGEVYVPDEPPGWEGKISQSDIKKIRRAGVSINKFAFKLYPLMAGDAEGNILFSPYNLAMTLVQEYRSADRKTRRELKRALSINGDSIDDFALLAQIIEDTPEDRGDFCSDGKDVFFKSDWEFPFNNYEEDFKTSLERADFYKPNGELQSIDIMFQDQRLKYYENSTIKSFEFPFVDRYYSYIILLPREGWDERRMRDTLNYKKYLSLLSKQTDKNLIVRIVDTKITSQYDFSSWLNTLGIKGGEREKLKQKNVINIYGGEQSRAVNTFWSTMLIRGTRAFYAAFAHPPLSPQEIEKIEKLIKKDQEDLKKEYPYNLDGGFYPTHPFVYFIVDNRSGAILLMGRYCGKEDSPNIVSK
ncbi:MAG: serpin family protein [Cloacibacillus sp.]